MTVRLFEWEDWDLIATIVLEYHGSFRRRYVELGFPLYWTVTAPSAVYRVASESVLVAGIFYARRISITAGASVAIPRQLDRATP